MQLFYENTHGKYHCRNNSGQSLECNPHLHQHIEIAVIYHGECNASVGNSESMRASDGDIILVFPNQVHAFETVAPENHILLMADSKFFPEFSHLFSDYLPKSPIIRGKAFNSELSDIAHRICETYNTPKSSYKDTILRGYFLAFMGRLFSECEFEKSISQDMDSIGQVINYCMANYAKNLSLDLLEKELHISKYHISHIINKKLHMGFNDYLNSIRTAAACRYLEEDKRSVSEISTLVGFNSSRTFNRAFVKHIGMSPREYKNRHDD